MTSVTVIVLGMHRSGTSSLAGMLESAGLKLGEVNTAAPFNEKGNRENLEIMKLNDQILANTGHSWRNPPDGPATWTGEDRRRRDEIIASLASNVPWGFKDPRTLLTLDGWLEALHSPGMVGTFRHPKRVAHSLAHRPAPLHVPISDGIALWYVYNSRLLAAFDQHSFPLIDFDLPPESYTNRVAAVCAGLGLEAGDPGAFFERSLRSSDDDCQIALAPAVAELYDALVKRCT